MEDDQAEAEDADAKMEEKKKEAEEQAAADTKKLKELVSLATIFVRLFL